DRLAPAHRRPPRGHAGELEAGRGRDHRRLRLQRRGQEDLRQLEGTQALHPDRASARLTRTASAPTAGGGPHLPQVMRTSESTSRSLSGLRTRRTVVTLSPSSSKAATKSTSP